MGEGEPLIWTHWSRRFNAAIRLWDQIHRNSFNPLDPSDVRGREVWSTFTGRPFPDPWKALIPYEYLPQCSYMEVDGTVLAATALSNEIELWMEIAGLRLRFFAPPSVEKRVRLELTACHAFAGLVLQLAAALSGVSGFAVCSNDGKIYTPERQPRAGVGNYCSVQCKRAAHSEDMRRLRARRRAEKMKGANHGESKTRTE